MPLSLSDFSTKLLESGLIAQSTLDGLLGALSATDRPRDGETLARMLVQRQFLTPYQAQAIADGNGKTLVLGNYVVQDQLGRGGMGVVLKAVHSRMDRTVALKVLSAESVKTPSLVERFHREVKAAARLEHPNIVTAHDADEANGVHFLVMQFVDGQDLAAVVRARGPLGVAAAVHCILQAAHGLEYAHQHGVIHRDIKPGNLLLSKDGAVKILDMGLAHIDNPLAERHQDHSLTGSGMVMGTVDYMSPEQALNTRNADARSDQYSLGITLYFLLTGRPAYAGDTAMEKFLAHRDVPPPSLDHLSHELNAIFHKMVAKKPADRFASMTEVIASLAIIESSLSGAPTATYAPLSRASDSASDTDAALAAFLQQSATGTTAQAARASVGLLVQNASSASAADVPTVLGTGAIVDTATTWRHPESPRSLHTIPRWVGIIAAGAVALGLIAWLAVLLLNRPGTTPSIADLKTPSPGLPPDNSPPAAGWHGWPADAPPPAIAPFDAAQAKKLQEAWAAHLGVPVEYQNSIGMKFRLIPPGEFLMGSTEEEIADSLIYVPQDKHFQECIRNQAPRHSVILTQPFYLGTFEVTQGEYERVVGNNPSHFSASGEGKILVAGIDTNRFPADQVSWLDAAKFANQLSELEKLKAQYSIQDFSVRNIQGNGYRLPTDAQWEYACRAGTTTAFLGGDDENSLLDVAWFKANAKGRTHAVGELSPNAFGLHDVIGNVLEWVQDWWVPGYFSKFAATPAVDPLGPMVAAQNRIERGGLYDSLPFDCKSASRHGNPWFWKYPQHGFRVLLTVDAVRQKLKETENTSWHGWPADAPKPAIAPFNAEQAKQHQEAWAAYLKAPVEWTNSIGMKFTLIPPGEFMMGSPPEEREQYRGAQPKNPYWPAAIESEGPQHTVVLTKPFYLSVFETRQKDYETVIGSNPSSYSATGERQSRVANLDTSIFPVDHTSWNDAADFCERLSQKEGHPLYYARSGEKITIPSGDGYRLPSEAEWEYACRAGTTTTLWCGSSESDARQGIWYRQNSENRPHAVGELTPNPFGLFDVLGNMPEWCHDGSLPSPYKRFAQQKAIDPVVKPEEQDNPLRLYRGGSFLHEIEWNRSAMRSHFADKEQKNGFRVAISVDAVERALNPPAKLGWHNWPADAPKPAIAPFDAAQAKQHQAEWAAYLKVPVKYENSVGMKFQLIPPGEFQRGMTPDEMNRALSTLEQNLVWNIRSSGPQHRVVLTRPIFLGSQEVTQGQFERVMGRNPSAFSPRGQQAAAVAALDTALLPVETVSWIDGVEFCQTMSTREGLMPHRYQNHEIQTQLWECGYRLPTEAEWEFAVRAGTASSYWAGNDAAALPKLGWSILNSGGRTHHVGEASANPFGLYDTQGNVWEWLLDSWTPNSYEPYTSATAVDPFHQDGSSIGRVVRGGGWNFGFEYFHSGFRGQDNFESRDMHDGFRVVLPVDAVRQIQAGSQSALSFDGDGDYVEVAKFPPCGRNTVMLEAWVRPKSDSDAANVISWLGPNWISLFQAGDKWGVAKRLDDNSRVMISDATVVPDAWVHLAATSEGDQLKLYVNGKPATLERNEFPLEPTEQGLYLGGCPVEKLNHDGERWFHGDIRQVRISQGIRNSAAFFPEREFAVDDATLACYKFRERVDDVLRDAGKQRHGGKIIGAKWVPLDRDSLPEN